MILHKYDVLINEAIRSRRYSYSPYSKYKVGCAILCKNGTVYTGCNIENAAFGDTMCAERVAIFKAISEGACDFKAICVVGGIDEIKDYAYPCGSCRQVLCEHCDPSLEIVLFNGSDTKICTLGQLFPFSFGKESIK